MPTGNATAGEELPPAGGIQALQSLAPSNLPRLTGVQIDGPVILYASLAALVTGLLFGTAPALQSAAVTAGEFLKEGGRTGSVGSRSRRLRSAVAIVEIAGVTDVVIRRAFETA